MNNSKFIGKNVKILISSNSGSGSAKRPSSIIMVTGVIERDFQNKYIEISNCVISYADDSFTGSTITDKTELALINLDKVISIALV